MASADNRTDVDVVVVGAGPAGLSAARQLMQSGCSVALLEARKRIGGRTHSIALGSQTGVDVGAHWLHASRTNPLVQEARTRGIALSSADSWPIVYDGDRTLGPWGQMRLWRAWRKIDKGIVRLADHSPDAAANLAIDRTNRWHILAGNLHGSHACGVDLSQVSVEDFANALDSDDRFVEGGYGGLVAAAGSTAAPRLDVTVTGLDWRGDGVAVETTQGKLHASAVILTIPTEVLAREDIRFQPNLPDSHRRAIHSLPHGHYERLVFTLGDDPFPHERDRAVILMNEANQSLYLLAGGGGRGVHFADFGGDEARELAAAGMAAMADLVRHWLEKQVGASVANSLRPLYASNWSGDPFSCGGWSVARPGCASARRTLRDPVANRIWFAGEATSIMQWGTVGGAWLEGQRAASDVAHMLADQSRSYQGYALVNPGKAGSGKSKRGKRPRNLT